MVMVTAGRNERGLRALALHQLEAEHATIENKGTVEIGDFQVNVPNLYAWINGPFGLAFAYYGA